MANSKVRKWLILFLVLLFPSLLYVLLSTGKHHIIRLPHFGPKQFVAQEGVKKVDTTYYQVPSFQFIDQQGNTISSSELAIKTKVYSLTCFTCRGNFSERLTSELAQLQLRFENRSDLVLISLIVDGNTLSESQKTELINKYAPKDDFWKISFLDNSFCQQFAESALLLDNFVPNIGSPTFVLVDINNHIRGYYNGIEYLEVKDLIDGIKVLKAEEFIPRKES